jgi:hypothetical protein
MAALAYCFVDFQGAHSSKAIIISAQIFDCISITFSASK